MACAGGDDATSGAHAAPPGRPGPGQPPLLFHEDTGGRAVRSAPEVAELMGGRGPRETAPWGPRGPACPARSPPEGRGATCTNNPGGHAGGRHSLEPGGDPGPRAPGAGVARGPRAGDCVPSRPACGFDRASGGRSLCPSWRDRSPRHHGGRSVTVTLPHALQTPFFPSRPRPGGRPPPSLCVRAPQEGARAPGERSGRPCPGPLCGAPSLLFAGGPGTVWPCAVTVSVHAGSGALHAQQAAPASLRGGRAQPASLCTRG